MGIVADWISDFDLTLKEMQVCSSVKALGTLIMVELSDFPIVFNMLSPHSSTISEVIHAEAEFERGKRRMVNVWEDQWKLRRPHIISRIQSIVEKNVRLGARSCTAVPLLSADAKLFFEANHLQGYVKVKQHFALFHKGEIVATAAFDIRPMNFSPNYRSAELVRYCTKAGITVVGGLGKLIKRYIQLEKPNDIMTYADKDWSRGHGYIQLGFTFVNETAPIKLYLDEHSKRVSETKLRLGSARPDFTREVFTTGNIKYILYL